MEVSKFYIEDLCCIDEERSIRKKFRGMPGIDTLTFDLISRRIIVRHSCRRHEIADALHDIGFASRLESETRQTQSAWEKHQYAIFTLISGACFGAGIILLYTELSPTIPTFMFLTAIVAGGWKTAGKAFHSLKEGTLDMNALMLIASVGAIAIEKYEEAAAVIFLFAVSNLLERYSLERTKRRIEMLMEFAPSTATRITNGSHTTVPVGDILPGERVLIRPGERIPLDGKVVAGRSTVNESAITGESRSHAKAIEDLVYGGSLNGNGVLEIDVLRLSTDTTLARIVRMVEEAQMERAPIQTLGETFARYYTPSVLFIAIFLASVPPLVLHQPFGAWFYRSLVMLVIACPCALVISTPVALVSALSNAARHGVLIKGGRHLEAMGNIAAIAFDKTGTLTVGAPRVTDVIPLQSLSEKEILRIASIVEQRSEHHLAEAVVNKALDENISHTGITYEHVEALAGRGVYAKVDGEEYFVGNHALIEERKICSPQIEKILSGLENDGKTTIIIARGDVPIGIIGVEDAPKEESGDVVRLLHSCGIQKVIMLTGDSEATAKHIAKRVKMDEVYANLFPEDKLRIVKSLKEKYGSVAMVGDGINDAPALAASTVGIAMGTSGTDIAMESADIVLMSDELSKLPYLVNLGRKTLGIIKQNMAIALVTKLIFIGLGIMGSATLWMAILADDGATLVVILNGLRALRLRDKDGTKG